MSAQELRRVLVVDDEENIRLLLGAALGQEGIDVALAASGEEALAALAERPTDAMLCDIRMPGMDGLTLVDEVRRRHPGVVVIVMSAYGSVDTAVEAIQRGAYDYVSKPFRPVEAIIALRKAEERERLRRENERLRRRIARAGDEPGLEGMVARSEAMRQVSRTARKIAPYKTTVLVQGESGTGKELVVRALHRLSPRADRPFVAINCGAIPESLLESELFGHKRGAFTDATRDKPGLVDEADGGTLFLDEVGELPLALQVKLLRLLQEEEVRSVGETRDRKVDIRVVAATVRDLGEEVRAGRFREDLYYRLNVVPLAIPPLRERMEDVPPLAEHFLERINARLGTRVAGIAPGAYRRLMAYPWPGNVRELENTIEHAVVLTEGDRVEPASLPPRIRDGGDGAPAPLAEDTLSIKKAARMTEERLIRRALEQTGGNRTAACKLLEISHRALLYKIKEYGLGDL